MSSSALAWTNLTFKSKSFFKKDKTILNQLNGQVNFGEVTALMGPSGAGKTTLLKCISGSNQSGLTQNSQLFISKNSVIKPCFIVQDQTEQLMINLTVRESLEYASMLKNSRIKVNHQEIVKNVTNELLLTKCLNTPVKRCSGGEQKRLAIAMELTEIKKPNLMCFDEPTTGLDSGTAERLMILLRQLASRHKIAVVVSIHQPNSDIINLIDHLYVLSVLGYCVYDGHPKDLRHHLVDCQIPERELRVPIQGLLKVATKIQTYGPKQIDIGPEIRRLVIKTRKQQSLHKNCKDKCPVLTGKIKSSVRHFSFTDFYRLLCRNATNFLIRDWRYQLFQALLLLLCAGIFLLLFPNTIGQDANCPPDVINHFNLTEITSKLFNSVNGIRRDSDLNTSFLFLFALLFNFTLIMAFSFKIPAEIQIFLNENRNGWYSTSSYYLAFTLMHLPVVIVINYLYSWISYYGTSQLEMTDFWQGLWDQPEPFQLFVLFNVVVVISFQGVAVTNAIIFADSPPLSMAGTIFLCFCYFFYNDYMIPIHELGLYEQTMAILSYFNLLFRSSLIILYGGNRCDGDESSVLAFFRIEEDKFWFLFQLIVGQGLFWRVLSYFILLWKANNFWDKITFKKRKINFEIEKNFALQEFENRIEIDEPINGQEYFNHHNKIITSYNRQVSMALAWQNLTITINKKSIFENLSGIVNFGEIIALMGPSGAGKTTLLNTINGRNYKNMSEESKIFVRKDKRVKQCFVAQDQKQHLIMSLTVVESLNYASHLKNSKEKMFNHKENVSKIVDELLLTNCLNNGIAKCSGGEQKRLSIAQELTAKDKPNLICIDEPTSGLDSCSAEATIACLQNLAHKNDIAIVTSIHQPDHDVIELFDKIYVLSSNGKCIFYGEPEQIKDHLQKCGVHCQDWQVPVEEMIKLASFRKHPFFNRTSLKEDQEKNIKVLIRNMSVKADEKIAEELKQKEDWQLHFGAFSPNTKRFNLFDFWWLTARHFKKQLIREWLYQLALICFVLTCGITCMRNFPSNLGHDPGCPQEVIDLTDIHLINQPILDGITGFEQRFSQNVKLMYLLLIVLLSVFTLQYSFVFINEIQIFFNEHRNGWYSTSSFFWSRNVIELLLPIPLCYVYSLLIYAGTSQPDLTVWWQAFWDVPQRFFLFFVVIFANGFNAIGFGILTCCIFPRNFALTILTYTLMLITCFWLSGLYIPFTRLNPLLKIIASPNFARMGLESLVIILYGGRCPDKAIALNMLEISEDVLYTNIGLMFVLGFVYRLISLTILWLRVGNFSSQIKK